VGTHVACSTLYATRYHRPLTRLAQPLQLSGAARTQSQRYR